MFDTITKLFNSFKELTAPPKPVNIRSYEEDVEFDCPIDCGGCSCHINPPCGHCMEHCRCLDCREDCDYE